MIEQIKNKIAALELRGEQIIGEFNTQRWNTEFRDIDFGIKVTKVQVEMAKINYQLDILRELLMEIPQRQDIFLQLAKEQFESMKQLSDAESSHRVDEDEYNVQGDVIRIRVDAHWGHDKFDWFVYYVYDIIGNIIDVNVFKFDIK